MDNIVIDARKVSASLLAEYCEKKEVLSLEAWHMIDRLCLALMVTDKILEAVANSAGISKEDLATLRSAVSDGDAKLAIASGMVIEAATENQKLKKPHS